MINLLHTTQKTVYNLYHLYIWTHYLFSVSSHNFIFKLEKKSKLASHFSRQLCISSLFHTLFFSDILSLVWFYFPGVRQLVFRVYDYYFFRGAGKNKFASHRFSRSQWPVVEPIRDVQCTGGQRRGGGGVEERPGRSVSLFSWYSALSTL